MLSKETPPQSPGETLEGRPTPNRPRRVMLIDYDDQLSEVMAGLLADDGLEVISHTCPAEACICAERALETHPDVILVNIAHPAGWLVDTHGWRCLKYLASNPQTRHLQTIAYTVLDSYALSEVGVDLRSAALPIRSGMTNPGRVADEVARRVRVREAA